MKKKLLIFFSLIAIFGCEAGKADQSAKNKSDRVIVGTISEIKLPSYEGVELNHKVRTELYKMARYEIVMAPDELLLSVKYHFEYENLSNEEVDMLPKTWYNDSHPRLEHLPDDLPLHLFLNEHGVLKDEGEKVEFYYNGFDKPIKVSLTIRTKKSSVRSLSSLELGGKPTICYDTVELGYRGAVQKYLDKNPEILNHSLSKTNN